MAMHLHVYSQGGRKSKEGRLLRAGSTYVDTRRSGLRDARSGSDHSVETFGRNQATDKDDLQRRPGVRRTLPCKSSKRLRRNDPRQNKGREAGGGKCRNVLRSRVVPARVPC